MKLYEFDPFRRKKILAGRIHTNPKGRGFFIKEATEKHLMKMMDAYAIQESIFRQFPFYQVFGIVVKELDTGFSWVSKPEDWTEHGKVADYGHGKQVFLSRKYMRRIKTPPPGPRQGEPEQQDLFSKREVNPLGFVGRGV